MRESRYARRYQHHMFNRRARARARDRVRRDARAKMLRYHSALDLLRQPLYAMPAIVALCAYDYAAADDMPLRYATVYRY